MTMTIAEKIKAIVYENYDPHFEGHRFYDHGFYSMAIRLAEGEGTCVSSSNDGQSTVSFAPTLEYVFKDGGPS